MKYTPKMQIPSSRFIEIFAIVRTFKKQYLSVCSSLLLIIGCFSCTPSSQEQTQETFIRNYFQRYPEATLQDVYKGSFQDIFGPAHILTNREAVERYIIKEMESADTWENQDYVPCGWQGNFYQVNLKVIHDGRIPMDDFVDAFMASANGIDTTLTASFIKEWQQLQQVVRTVVPDLPGFKEDSTLLANLLKDGKYVVHHSKAFNKHYHPHYRIIRKDIFEEKILPKL